MCAKDKQLKLLPYEVIELAVTGDTNAISKVLEHYKYYIRKLALQEYYNENGERKFYVDETLKQQLEIKLITKILDFKIK